MRDLLNKLAALEESTVPELGDEFGISFSPDLEISTEIVGFLSDGIVIELDETALGLMESAGSIFLDGELINEEKQKGVDGKACWKGYKRMGTKQKGGKTVDNCVKVSESAEQLDIQQLATISDEALDKAYGYGRSSPGNTFGWQANLKSAAYAKQMIDKGVTDIEEISNAIHKGWNVTAKAFVQDPTQFDDTEKLKAAGKLEAKLQQREKLMSIDYSQLPDDEQEKDRVVARALLQAIKGEKDVDEAKYQGREVPLGKKMAGDVKKSKVYVRKPNGNIVKVNFGDKKMRIKKSNPARRKSFRARHNCKNPGPRWKARYWSCRSW
jgi:hypothetical protein